MAKDKIHFTTMSHQVSTCLVTLLEKMWTLNFDLEVTNKFGQNGLLIMKYVKYAKNVLKSIKRSGP